MLPYIDYIDPGTGSMLFSILIGVISAGIYAIKKLMLKIKFRISGGTQEMDSDRLHFVIFTDDKRYWNVFRPICDEFEKRKEIVHYYTASKDDPALSCNYEYVRCNFLGEGNRAFAKMNMIKADVVVSSTPSLDVYQWKRSKDVLWYVHIPHAASDITLYRMFGIDYYDALLLSGDYQIKQVRELERTRNLPEKECTVIGLTYFDEMKKRISTMESKAKENITVLLAPSWGVSSILNKYGETFLELLIDTGYDIIVRPHPQSFVSEKEMICNLMEKFKENEHFAWNRDNDNFDVLNRADVLISDFSGVIFDFALVFDKPIIYADTSFDIAPYDACWLKEEPWTFSVLPKLGPQINNSNIYDIKSIIENCVVDNAFQEARNDARNDAWQNEGNAAATIVDYLLEKRMVVKREVQK